MVRFHVLTLNPKTSDSLKYFCSLRLFQNQSVQLLSHVQLFVTLWTAACQASLSITDSQSPHKPMSIDSVMPSHPLSSPSPPALSLSQNQGFFQCVCCLHQTKYWSSVSASVLWMKSQGWFLSGLTSLITLQSKWVSIVFPSTTVWKHQFFNTQPSLRSNSHICTWLLAKPPTLSPYRSESHPYDLI